MYLVFNVFCFFAGDPNSDFKVNRDDLPITPSYITHPPFPYLSSGVKAIHDDSPVNVRMSGPPGKHIVTSQLNTCGVVNKTNRCPVQDDEGKYNRYHNDIGMLHMPRIEHV